MALSEANICFDCKRASGRCPWSETDPVTNKTRFAPVPGWTAQETMLNLGTSHGKRMWQQTYHITDCPLFERG